MIWLDVGVELGDENFDEILVYIVIRSSAAG
jgi:hypothetical protein